MMFQKGKIHTIPMEERMSQDRELKTALETLFAYNSLWIKAEKMTNIFGWLVLADSQEPGSIRVLGHRQNLNRNS